MEFGSNALIERCSAARRLAAHARAQGLGRRSGSYRYVFIECAYIATNTENNGMDG